MNISKVLVTVMMLLIASYVAFTWRAMDLGSEESNCQYGISKILAPWTSGCFYVQDFDELSLDASSEQLKLENHHLNEFKRRGGVPPEILWYRAEFNRKYQNTFKQNFEQLHYMHLDYTLSEHTRLDRQVEYFRFLITRDLSLLAQKSLNQYCESYLRVRRPDILEKIHVRLVENGLELSLDKCINQLETNYREIFIKNNPQ